MKRRPFVLLVALCIAALVAPAASAGSPDPFDDPPILSTETTTGSIVRSAAAPVEPTVKVVDGDPADWAGEATKLGGTSIYSRGEYVHQDYVGDAWGADDGFDAGRLERQHALRAIEPRTYRVDVLQQAAGAQFGAPRPVGASLNYGDVAVADAVRAEADIAEARVGADASRLTFMVRTTSMSDPAPATALVVLLDTEPGGAYRYPRIAESTGAEWVFVATRHGVLALHKGFAVLIACEEPCDEPLVAAFDGSGFRNTAELSISRGLLGALPATIGVGVATGLAPASGLGLAAVAPGDAKSDLVNVAFRREPARIWMDERQALALRLGTIDAFLAPVDLSALQGGRTETFAPRPGYFEAIYLEPSSPVNVEGVTNNYHQGVWQHYGVYLPSTWTAGASHPTTFWMHYRGGHAHDAAAWEPGILREFGEEIGGVVVTPSARGTSSWYTGRGMVDFLSVWDDATARWGIDDARVYLAGHSMGGWASNLLGLLMPDRWAASNPQDGLLVPGLWAGAGPPTQPQNGADVEAEFLYPLLENARNLPYAILHGTLDELVPVSGVVAQGARFHELGYRYRAYLFHAYEHYSAPIWDEWREMVRYMTQFRRDPNPARVTYRIKPALDHAVSTISAPAGVDLGLRFDKAYWVSGLRTRTPGRAPSNIGEIDATTHGRGVPSITGAPEASAGVDGGPYTMHGQRWLTAGTSAPANRFEAKLSNLSTATLDVARMALGTAERIDATVTTDGPAELRLRGSWPAGVVVSGATATIDGDALVITLPAAGTFAVRIG